MRRARMFPDPRIRPGVSIPGAAVESLPGGAVAVYDFARTNFLNWTEDFTNAAWTKSGSTASDPSVNDPATGAKAWRITSTGTDPYVAQFVTGNPSELTVTYSVRIKMEGVITGRSFRFYSYGSSATEAIASSGFFAATGDWQTLTFNRTFPAGMASTSHVFRIDVPENGAVIGDTVLIASPTLNLGSAALPYEKQTDGQTLLDRSGNNNNGTLGATGGAEGSDPMWTAQGLMFDGIDDRVVLPGTILPLSYTYVAAVIVDATVTANVRILGAQLGGTTNTLDLTRGDTASSIEIRSNVNGSVAFNGSFGQAFPKGVPTMVSVAHNRTTGMFNFWSGGTPASGGTSATHINALASSIINLGSESVPGSAHFKGTYYYAILYPRILTTAEVAQAYRAIKRTLAARGVTLP